MLQVIKKKIFQKKELVMGFDINKIEKQNCSNINQKNLESKRISDLNYHENLLDACLRNFNKFNQEVVNFIEQGKSQKLTLYELKRLAKQVEDASIEFIESFSMADPPYADLIYMYEEQEAYREKVESMDLERLCRENPEIKETVDLYLEVIIPSEYRVKEVIINALRIETDRLLKLNKRIK